MIEIPKPKYLDYNRALCAQTDPELFFPDRTNNYSHLAKKICQRCEVRVECLMEALANNYEDGIWGGLSPKERYRLKKNNSIPIEVKVSARRGRPPKDTE